MRRPYHQSTLTDRDRKVMEIERRWGPGPTALPMKLDAARTELGLDAKTYAFVVNALIDDPIAHQMDPRTMGNLRNIRAQHRAARGA